MKRLLWGMPLVGECVSPLSQPFPAYDEDRKLAEAVLQAGWGFASSRLRRRCAHNSALPGASTVLTVYPTHPPCRPVWKWAILFWGPPMLPSPSRNRSAEWVMTAPIGTPTPLQVLRGEQQHRLTPTPQRYPIKWPSLPGPPQVGSDVQPLPALTPYRGALPVELTRGGPYLLFFWATWCAPCKASLPEVVAFERESGVPVVAITDEPPEKLDAFFAKYNGPFPAIVAVDELRRAFLAYGVSGTPTFVLTDVTNKVQSIASGYRPDIGLQLAGWSWSKRNQVPVQESRP